MPKQIHFEFNLLYWHHSQIEGQPYDLISFRFFEINLGSDDKGGNLFGITQLPINGYLVFNILFLFAFVVPPFWKRKKHGK